MPVTSDICGGDVAAFDFENDRPSLSAANKRSGTRHMCSSVRFFVMATREAVVLGTFIKRDALTYERVLTRVSTS